MKKKILVFGVIIVCMSLMVINETVCHTEFQWHCFFGQYTRTILEPLTFGLMSLFITSIFTFFISDKSFKKWLIFTAVWMISTVILVLLAPVSGGGPLGLGPDKELVSIWMSSLFVFISILMFIIMSVRERQKKS